jgi:ribosomal protein L7/L12
MSGPHPREDCYFCDESDDVLETHHVVPRRHGGSDEANNLVDVCPTCHQKLERLYDDQFYKTIGAAEIDEIIQCVVENISQELNELSRQVSEEIGQSAKQIREDYGASVTPEAIAEEANQEAAESLSPDIYDGPLDADDRVEIVADLISELEQKHDEGAPVESILNRAQALGMDRSKAEHAIEKLRRQGDVYQPLPDYVRGAP